jgi:outer membrane murein-binding lipoprotein Lpp
MKKLLLLLALAGSGLLLMGCTNTISMNMASGHAVEKISDEKSEKVEVESEVKGSGSLFGL